MQPLLVLGGLALMAIGTVSLNHVLLDTRQDLQDARLALPAVNSAHSLIGWASALRYDETGAWVPLQQLTDWDNLGPEVGESPDSFDDVDDLNGLVQTFTTAGVSVTATCSVSYVQESDLTTPVHTRTHHKLLTVTVSGDYLEVPVIYQTVFSSGA